MGKTLILNQLKKEGEPVLDLEGFAGHRGSVFGSIGIEEKNQKSFDGELFDTLW
ncbi:MAG TPA: tRNA 2-selenouridine synthase, partial [Paenibacillaceae bacterium]|nr:tRNA 2-selenouridine synthase [Paenibacillaceae bacterium]